MFPKSTIGRKRIATGAKVKPLLDISHFEAEVFHNVVLTQRSADGAVPVDAPIFFLMPLIN